MADTLLPPPVWAVSADSGENTSSSSVVRDGEDIKLQPPVKMEFGETEFIAQGVSFIVTFEIIICFSLPYSHVRVPGVELSKLYWGCKPVSNYRKALKTPTPFFSTDLGQSFFEIVFFSFICCSIFLLF